MTSSFTRSQSTRSPKKKTVGMGGTGGNSRSSASRSQLIENDWERVGTIGNGWGWGNVNQILANVPLTCA